MTYRTYPYGARASQLLDSLHVLAPGVSKSEIANLGVFLVVYQIKEIMARDPDMTAALAYAMVRRPLEGVYYEDLLFAVTPRLRDQTSLDDFIKSRADAETEGSA